MEIVGYAIASADGLIADARGVMPPALKLDADQRHFRRALDGSDLTVLGRLTHEAAPNVRRRRRLVVSRRVAGFVREDEVTFRCDPGAVGLGAALARLVGPDGRVAVVGGTAVFDAVLDDPGYTAFHLSVARSVRLGTGRPLFTGADSLEAAVERLAAHGLTPVRREWLDRAADLELTVYGRPGG